MSQTSPNLTSRSNHRRSTLAIAVALLLYFVLASIPPRLVAAAETTPSGIKVDASTAQPRQVEEATVQAIQRDYGKAWQTLSQAMAENRSDTLASAFVGIAKDKLTQAVNEQKSEGLRRKYVDKGHRLEVVFYSIDGSALQLRDTAQVEIQLLDGDKVVHSENANMHFMVLMTPAENSWKVRLLEATPGS
jgi:hypothetical protein